MKASDPYRIIATPASGALSSKKGQTLLRDAASILQADVHGLDTGSAAEPVQCAREQAHQCDLIDCEGKKSHSWHLWASTARLFLNTKHTGWKAQRFVFTVLPGGLRLKH